MADVRSGERGSGRSGSGREAGHPRWRAIAVAVAALSSAVARGQPTPAPLASVPAPTGVLADPSGDVVVVSGTPAGASLVRLGADGTKKDEAPLDALGAAGEARIAMLDTDAVQAIALLTPSGSLVVLRADAEPVEFGLGELPAATAALDLEGGTTPVDLDTRGATFGDVAAIPSDTASGTGDARPAFDFFVTGVTAANAALGGKSQPFLLRARVRLGATPAESSVAVQGLATTQATVTDPAHRSGVGVYWNRGGPGAPTPGTGLVLATLPTSTSTAAGDALVFVGAGWPEVTGAEPPSQLTDLAGTPIFARSSGMTQDATGNVYLLLTTEACAAGGSPGVVAITADSAPCTELPVATATAGDYVDVGVRGAGDPAYVTDRTGNAVLNVTTGVQATPGPSPVARSVASRLGAALGRLGAR